MSKVVVVASPLGQVITVSEKNPEYGSIRVEQHVFEFNNKGFMTPRKRVAFIKGKVEHLKLLDYSADTTLEGKIVVLESLQAPNPDNSLTGIKRAFDEGPVCLHGDEPIYRTTFYTTNIELQDTLIQHTNINEVREAVRLRDKKIQEADLT